MSGANVDRDREPDPEAVYMLDDHSVRRYHLTPECPHVARARSELRRLPFEDREVERALLCAWCAARRNSLVRR